MCVWERELKSWVKMTGRLRIPRMCLLQRFGESTERIPASFKKISVLVGCQTGWQNRYRCHDVRDGHSPHTVRMRRSQQVISATWLVTSLNTTFLPANKRMIVSTDDIVKFSLRVVLFHCPTHQWLRHSLIVTMTARDPHRGTFSVYQWRSVLHTTPVLRPPGIFPGFSPSLHHRVRNYHKHFPNKPTNPFTISTSHKNAGPQDEQHLKHIDPLQLKSYITAYIFLLTINITRWK